MMLVNLLGNLLPVYRYVKQMHRHVPQVDWGAMPPPFILRQMTMTKLILTYRMAQNFGRGKLWWQI